MNPLRLVPATPRPQWISRRGWGESEMRIGLTAAGDADCRVLTKLDPALHRQGLGIAETLEAVSKRLQASRSALGRDVLPALMLHRFAHRQGFFPRARELGRTIYIRSIFRRGIADLEPKGLPIAAGDLVAPMRVIEACARRIGVSVQALFLAFARDLPGVHPVLECETNAQFDSLLASWASDAVDAAAISQRIANTRRDDARPIPLEPELEGTNGRVTREPDAHGERRYYAHLIRDLSVDRGLARSPDFADEPADDCRRARVPGGPTLVRILLIHRAITTLASRPFVGRRPIDRRHDRLAYARKRPAKSRRNSRPGRQ
jgi:hypothetical protein